MSTSTLLQSLFRHKAWANEELYAELAKLDATAHAAERHAATRVLNHVYVVDRIFAAHLTGAAHGYSASNTTETPTLDVLRDAVAASDRWFVDYVGTLAPQALATEVAFTFTDGTAARMSREEMLAHVATHGSYHRGGVGRILAQAGGPLLADTYTAYLHRSEPRRRERAPE